MNAEEARARAENIVKAWFIKPEPYEDTPKGRIDLNESWNKVVCHSYSELIDALAAALLDAGKVAEGFVRVGEKDMKLLGDPPLTQDGCFVGLSASLWAVVPHMANANKKIVVHMTPNHGASDHWRDYQRDFAACHSTEEAAQAARGGEQ